MIYMKRNFSFVYFSNKQKKNKKNKNKALHVNWLTFVGMVSEGIATSRLRR